MSRFTKLRGYCATSSSSCSARAMVPLTADCTFSKARTSIWRTRSRDTPNSAARSSSVIGSSARRGASKMLRSPALATPAEPAVHVADVLVGDAEALGDRLYLIGAQIALVERVDLALRLAQVEEQR